VSLTPSVVVLPAFAVEDNAGSVSEVAPWLDAYDFEPLAVDGVAHPVQYDDDVVLAPTGIGKAAAATTVTALAAGNAVDLTDARIVTVGIAGAPPSAGTIGSVFVADAVVDWDPKLRFDDAIAPPRWAADHVWRLDESLVERAAEAAETVELVDGDDGVRRLRERYDDDRTPSVGVGPTVGSDELYHGRQITKAVERLCDWYGLDGYVTTEMEGGGTAAALERFGLLDRYVSVRAVSNFDREPPGGDPAESIERIRFEVAIENAVRAGRAVVERLCDDRR